MVVPPSVLVVSVPVAVVSVVVVAETSTVSPVVPVVSVVSVVVFVDTSPGSTSQLPYAVAMTRTPPTTDT